MTVGAGQLQQASPIQQASAVKVALVIVLGSFMTVLDGTVMNVALPALQGYFSSDDGRLVEYSLIAWTVTGYSLAQAVIIPLTDWGAKRFGARRLYISAIAVFTIASLACALAPSLPLLIVMRVVQGLGGGCMMPLGTAILARASGPERLGRMMAIMGVPMLLGPVLGPIVGGWILQYSTWHWIFLINIPFGLAGVVAGILVLPRDTMMVRTGLDFVGVLTMSPGLALTLWGVSSLGGAASPGDAAVVLPLVTGVAMVVLFAFRSVRQVSPLLDLTVFRGRGFRRPVLVMLTYQIGFFGTLLILPAYLQQVRGLTTLDVGLVMAPTGIGAILTMPVASSLVDRFPVGRIVPFGVATLGVSVMALALISSETPLGVLALILLVQGLGLGATMMPNSTAALKTIDPSKIGNATTVYNIVGQVASAVGTAVVSVVLAWLMSRRPLAEAAIANTVQGEQKAEGLAQAMHAFAGTFWLSAAVIGLGVVLSSRLPMRVPSGSRPSVS